MDANGPWVSTVPDGKASNHSSYDDSCEPAGPEFSRERAADEFEEFTRRRSSVRDWMQKNSLRAGPGGMLVPGKESRCQSNRKNFETIDDLRKGKVKNAYDVTDYYDATLSADIATNRHFEYFTLMMISFNAIWIGIDTDENDSTSGITGAEFRFQIMENIFAWFFSLEVGIRFLAFKRKINAFKDPWFVFDTILVLLMIMETWVLPLMGGTGGNSGGGLVRMFRLLRLTRMARLMRAVPELLVLIRGIAIAVRSVISTLALLIIFNYIFGIMFTLFLKPHPQFDDWYGTVATSMFTLLTAATLNDRIINITTHIREDPDAGAHVVIAFMLYVLVSNFTVLNMLIGILCEVITGTTKKEMEKALIAVIEEEIWDIFNNEIDVDGSGLVSRVEFEKMVDNPAVLRSLQRIGIQPRNLVALADSLFDSEEKDDDPTAKTPARSATRAGTSPLRSVGASRETLEEPTAEPAERFNSPVASSVSPLPVVPGATDEVVTVRQVPKLDEQPAWGERKETELTFEEFLMLIVGNRPDMKVSVMDVAKLRRMFRNADRQCNDRVDRAFEALAALQEEMDSDDESAATGWQDEMQDFQEVLPGSVLPGAVGLPGAVDEKGEQQEATSEPISPGFNMSPAGSPSRSSPHRPSSR
jgi:voltage-gated sodium channel